MEKIVVLFLLIFVSCKYVEKKNEDLLLARVYDKQFYLSDLNEVIPDYVKGNDSVELARQYVNSWIREMLLLHQSETNLTEQQLNVEKQLQNYRNSLITYIYEKELIKQKLDTSVLYTEIEKYYNANKENFELKNNIIKALYVKLHKDVPELTKFKQWLTSEEQKDREALESYCIKYASNYFLDDQSWLLFDDILKEVPIETYNKELFLQNNKLVSVQDSSYIYFMNIKGFKIKNSLSPLSFEKENIRNIILNKRKMELVNKMKEDIYKNALEKKQIEVYL